MRDSLLHYQRVGRHSVERIEAQVVRARCVMLEHVFAERAAVDLVCLKHGKVAAET